MEKLRARLEHEVAVTMGRLRAAGLAASGHAVEEAGRTASDLFEAAQASEQAERRLGEGQRLLRRLQRLRGALDRLDRGIYGTCVECELPIPRARLIVVPEAITCVPCQERRESRRAA